MRRILIAISLLLLTLTARAQWREIANFEALNANDDLASEYITCIYFLDLSGPPRIGFAGTETELHKTTDGGATWYSVWDSGEAYDNYYITDICFMDSMIGWFSIYDGYGATGDACYRTTDGGETWSELPVPNVRSGGLGIYYNQKYGRLFLSSIDTGLRISTDLGNSWGVIPTTPYGDGMSFSTDTMGIYAASTSDTSSVIMRTTDGGETWHFVKWDTVLPLGFTAHPFAISGTPFCFEVDYENIIVRRSTDYGQTWSVIANWGPFRDSNFNQLTPYSYGTIRGDLTRLYFQTDSGMYVSIDSGVTWKKDGGPGYAISLGPLFYATNNVTIAAKTYEHESVIFGGGLWEEIWPQAGVAESTIANSTNSLSVFPNPATNSITIESANGPVSILDPLGRSYTTPQPPPWKGEGVSIDISTLPLGVYFVSDGYSRSKFVKE